MESLPIPHQHHLKERIHDYLAMPSHVRWIFGIASFVLALGVIGLVSLQKPSSWSVGFKAVKGKMLADSNLSFSFSRPMSRDVNIVIEPQIQGNWFFEDRLSRLHLSREFRFEPLETWQPDTTYKVTFEKLRGIFEIGESAQNVAYSFTTQSSPEVTTLSPQDGDMLTPNSTFTITLDTPNASLAKYALVFDPPVETVMQESDDKLRYTFTPSAPLSQGTRYTANVIHNDIRVFRDSSEVSFEGEDETVLSRSWKVQEAPNVSDFSPTGSTVALAQSIDIVFTHEPTDESIPTIRIEPEVKGSWIRDGSKATFKPLSKLTFDTKYKVTIPKGFATQNGGFFEGDATYEFTTIGAVKVVSHSPAAGSAGVAADREIRIDFDQKVDTASAQAKFSITPEIAGSFSWDGATMIFDPTANLALDTGYTVNLASAIGSVTGLPSDREYAFTFTVQPSVVKLAVKYDHQDYALSCEVAALKMALAYKGVSVSEDTLMTHVGYDPTPHEGNVWGDPYSAFVGDIRGKQSSTGYGVYWDPIAYAGGKYRTTESFTNGTIQKLTDEVSKGNPVVVWGNAGSGKRVDWVTPRGKSIYAINGEHTRVVMGFIGPKDNPSKIIVNDPLYGEVIWNTTSFDANWAMLFRAGVIVR